MYIDCFCFQEYFFNVVYFMSKAIIIAETKFIIEYLSILSEQNHVIQTEDITFTFS